MTRERAISLAKRWAEDGVCTLSEGEAKEYHEMCLEALRERDAKWISVKDRLPKPIDNVLVYHEDGTIEIEWLYHAGDFAYEGIYGTVTHWMPLPEPPKEDAECH